MAGYYAFTVSAQNTGKAAYIGVLFSAGDVFQGGFNFRPTATGYTIVGTDASDINLQLPPVSSLGGGVSLTADSSVAGTIYVSPALSVPVTFTLYGNTQIGTVTVNPGQTQVPFNFPVSSSQALEAKAATAMIAKEAPKPENVE